MSGDFQIGEWRVQPAVNRIARGDRVVRIEPKVMQVLVCLAERAGEVVTREQLISRVWSDVFVTDDVLHRAIRELRRVFGDSTTQPAYIETIRKRGYRLMVPIGQAEAEALTLESTAPADKGLLASPTREGAVVHTAPRWSFSVVAAFVALLTAIGVVIVASRSHEATSEAHARFVPVVSGPLNESDPAISPDGQRIAFVQRTADASSSADIYIRDLASGRVTRVTLGSSSDRMPAWSPDASRLAFIRSTSSSCDIVIRSLSTDIDSMIAPCANLDDPRVAWTQDGRALITSRAPDAHAASGWQLARLDIATATATPITSPPHGVVGDHAPSVSPDGRRLRSSGVPAAVSPTCTFLR